MKEDVLIENVRYVMEKNPEHNEKLKPVLEYLDNLKNIVRVSVKVDKADGTRRVWYFGTDGGSGHYPKCIEGSMTSEEYSMLCNADSESFEKTVCTDYSGYIPDAPMCGSRWSIYGIPYSVDDHRSGSHTYLFMEGCYTKEEMLDYIKFDGFLRKQFDLC